MGAFENLDAVHKGVLDAGHGVSYYWIGKHKAATLFAGAPGGPFGMDMIDFFGWFYEGGGLELYQDIMKLNGFVENLRIPTRLMP